jgi:hypothetical protein
VGSYTSAQQFIRPSDKQIDWSAEYKEFIDVPRLREYLSFYEIRHVPDLVEVPVLVRPNMGRTCGCAHMRYSPAGKQLYYITMSKEWWKTLLTNVPPYVFQREWKMTLAHEFAHVICFAKREYWRHSDPWRRFAKLFGDDGTRLQTLKGYVPGTKVLWSTIEFGTDQRIQAGKEKRFAAKMAAFTNSQSKKA